MTRGSTMMIKASQKLLAITLGLFSAMMVFAIGMPYSVAESITNTAESQSDTVYIPIDAVSSIEKTTIGISISPENTLPWAYVNGVVDNPVQGHPVIIQFFDESSNDEPMHVAQVDVDEDGSYEYKFRVRDVDLETGKVTNIFEGDYVVKIFKVVSTNTLEEI